LVYPEEGAAELGLPLNYDRHGRPEFEAEDLPFEELQPPLGDYSDDEDEEGPGDMPFEDLLPPSGNYSDDEDEEGAGLSGGRRRRRRRGGSGERFKRCVASVRSRGYARNPAAVCAAIGRRKYGKQAFQRMAAAGRQRRRR
jgi:hypothetical protein